MDRYVQQGIEVKAPEPEPLKVGSEVWTINPRDRREGWKQFVIAGETRASWLVKSHPLSPPRKIAKATMLENHGPQWGKQRWYSAQDKTAREFIDRYRMAIAKRIGEEYRDLDIPLVVVSDRLKKIAEILGMELTDAG